MQKSNRNTNFISQLSELCDTFKGIKLQGLKYILARILLLQGEVFV